MRFRFCASMLAAARALALLSGSPTGGDRLIDGARRSLLGNPVRVEPLPHPLRLTCAGAAWRLLYLSTSFSGRATVVGGTITLPAGRPPTEGWPVVSFGHGFGGMADAHAPSRAGPGRCERAVTEHLLHAGYAIAMTDYEGIGTPGDTSVMDGRAEAYGMIDIVRAVRHLAPVSAAWAGVGYSLGGHAALFAGALAGDYAPELRHTGTIALAPITQWRVQLAAGVARDPAGEVNPILPYLARTLQCTQPDFRAADWFTAAGLALVEQAGAICVDDMASAVAGLRNGDIFLDPSAAADEFTTRYADEEVPAVRYERPVRLVHGSADVIPPILTEITAAQLAAAGTHVSYTPVDGADHHTLLPAVAPDVVGWTAELFEDPLNRRRAT